MLAVATMLSTGLVFQVVRRRPGPTLLGLALVAFALGGFNAGVHAREGAGLARAAASVPRCGVSGRVLEDIGSFGTLVAIDAVACDGVLARPGIAFVRDPPGPAGTLFSGEALLVPLDVDGPERVLIRAGARAKLYDLSIRSSRPPTGWQALAESVRASLVRTSSTAAPDQAALLRGLAIGDTSSLDGSIVEDFRRSGLSHIVAVSGSNVAIVLGAVLVLLRSVALLVRVCIAAGSLALFVLVVGPDPSVLRAAAMGGIALSSMLLGYRARPLNALGLAVLCVVGLRPGMVWSVGLHLSVAATAGLILFMGPISRRLGFLPEPVAAVAAATLAAQIGVMPILAAVFGEVSIVAPLANLLAIPAVAPATILSLASAVMGLVWTAGGNAMARAAAPFAHWILWVAERTAQPERAVIPMPAPVTAVVTVAVVLAAWAVLTHQPIPSEGERVQVGSARRDGGGAERDGKIRDQTGGGVVDGISVGDPRR
jgi:ComEC/Rec2-related protein